MNSARGLVRPALIYIFANALTAGIPLLLLPLFTRILSPEDYGRIAIFAVVVQLFGALTGLSVHGAIGVRFFDGAKTDFPRFVASCLTILAISGLALFGVVLLLLPVLESFTKLPAPWLLVAVVVSCANFVVQSQLAIFQSAEQPLHFGLLRLSQAGLDLGLSLLLVVALDWAWQGRAAGMASGALITAALALLVLWRGGSLRFPPRADYVRQAMLFGLPLVPHAIGGLLIASVDRFMIANILDLDSAGIYMVAVQIGLVFNLATDAGNRAFAPWLMQSLQMRDSGRDLTVVRLTYIGFALLLAGGIIVGLAAPSVLSFLAGNKFQGAGSIVIYIALGQAFGGMYYLVTNYVFFAGRTGRLAIVSLSSGLANVALSYVLLTTRGLQGAAQAFLIAQMLLFLGTWWLAARVRSMPWTLGWRRTSSG